MPFVKMFCALAAGFGIAVAAFAGGAAAQALDKVTFGTNWVAEAEHGGFYQAVADGTYRKFGLDVTILPGGPNANNRMLLLVDKIDFYLSANTLQGFDAVAHDVPTVEVAAMFQKDPQVLIAHPDQGIEKFAGSEEFDAVCLQRGSGHLLPVAQGGFRLQGQSGQALHLQSATVSSPTKRARCRAT